MADFMPKDDDELVTWLENLKVQIDVYGTTLGMTAAQITEFKAQCDELIAAIQIVLTKKRAWQDAATNAATVEKTVGKKLRDDYFNPWKAASFWTDAIGQAFHIVGTGTIVDTANYKPTKVKAEARAGLVRVTYEKQGVDGMNIYMRLRGETAWRKLGFDKKSPFDDRTPLAVAGTPEVREYRLIGVIDDEEIGQPSDIVSVTFAG